MAVLGYYIVLIALVKFAVESKSLTSAQIRQIFRNSRNNK
jgi:hypothetical protein